MMMVVNRSLCWPLVYGVTCSCHGSIYVSNGGVGGSSNSRNGGGVSSSSKRSGSSWENL